ncbi:unnamed protein product [Amoebophrya sp. A120]|nr:unnamed protein product [Amoebophrya sp. A120]|eukprot:GSA120T00009535001.1
MFRNYTPKDVQTNKAKSSVERKIREDILESYPRLQPVMDLIWPKKNANILLGKTKNKIQLVILDEEVIFFQPDSNNPGKVWFPTLRLLHQYPSMMPKMQVDTGAIKFVLKGADVMCPGLTHPTGGAMEDVPKDVPVQIVAENKETACAVGLTAMSTEEIRKLNKGNGVLSMHSLGDCLWKEGKVV